MKDNGNKRGMITGGGATRRKAGAGLRRLGVAVAAASLSGVFLLGGTSAASAYGSASGGYTSCGSGTVVFQSSSTGSTYHRKNGTTITGHWINSYSTQQVRLSSTAASAITEWRIWSQDATLGYGYPRCYA